MRRGRALFLLIVICLLPQVSVAAADAVLLDVPAYNQISLGLPTGCEIVSTAMALNYHVEVAVDTLVSKMPYAANPNEGFRGNPRTTGGFTIFPPALLDVLADYVETPMDMSGCTMQELREQLSQGYPVAVWIRGMGWNVHCIALSGYNEQGFFYNDPYTGKKDVFISEQSFYAVWNQSIYDPSSGTNYEPRKALSYALAPPAPEYAEVALVVNGTPLSLALPAYDIDGTVMLPLAAVMEDIDWMQVSVDAEGNYQLLNKNTNTVTEMIEGAQEYRVDGVAYMAALPAQLVDDALYVPAKMLLTSERFGYDRNARVLYVDFD